nr:hypothetical protein [Tanacetum cinerariifolium]
MQSFNAYINAAHDGCTLLEIGVPQARIFLGCSFTGYGEEYHQLRRFRGRNNLVGTKTGLDALIDYSEDIQSHQGEPRLWRRSIVGSALIFSKALRFTLIKLDAIDAFTNKYNINIQYDTRSAVADGRLAYDRANLDPPQKLDYFRDQNNCNKLKHNSKYATAMVGLRTIRNPQGGDDGGEVIKRIGKQIQQLVKFWVEQYEKDTKPAVVELFTMMFEAFGAKYRIQGEFLHKIHKRLSDTQENITMIEDMMRKIFTGLLVHCYKVIDPDIRMSGIQSLRAWIVSYPSLFLQDLYLKYLGWTLNVKSVGIRKASILALQDVYNVDDNVSSFVLFTKRFYKRTLDLADDNDISFAVCAISLVKQLLRRSITDPSSQNASITDPSSQNASNIRRVLNRSCHKSR